MLRLIKQGLTVEIAYEGKMEPTRVGVSARITDLAAQQYLPQPAGSSQQIRTAQHPTTDQKLH
jgi:hypothetical protein